MPTFAQKPEREGIVEDVRRPVPEEVTGAAYRHEFGGPASVGLDLAGVLISHVGYQSARIRFQRPR